MDALCHGKPEFFASFPIEHATLGTNPDVHLSCSLGPTSQWTKEGGKNTGERMDLVSFRIFHVLAVPQ